MARCAFCLLLDFADAGVAERRALTACPGGVVRTDRGVWAIALAVMPGGVAFALCATGRDFFVARPDGVTMTAAGAARFGVSKMSLLEALPTAGGATAAANSTRAGGGCAVRPAG